MSDQRGSLTFWAGLLRSHKAATSVWLFFNALLAAVALAAAMSVVHSVYSPTGYVKDREAVMLILMLAVLWVYLYGFAYITEVFTAHISLSRAINGLTSLQAPAWIEELADMVLEPTPGFLLAIPLYYWCGYLPFSALFWLVEGRWPVLTTCDLFPMVCGAEIKAKGLAQLVRYVGENNLGLLLLLICIPCYLVTFGVSNSREKK